MLCDWSLVSHHSAQYAFDCVIDVTGGHGALAALFLITATSTKDAVVIDPARVGVGGVQRVWGQFWDRSNKELRFRHECFRTGFPAELDRALTMIAPHRIWTVACHACQGLADEILEISFVAAFTQR